MGSKGPTRPLAQPSAFPEPEFEWLIPGCFPHTVAGPRRLLTGLPCYAQRAPAAGEAAANLHRSLNGTSVYLGLSGCQPSSLAEANKVTAKSRRAADGSPRCGPREHKTGDCPLQQRATETPSEVESESVFGWYPYPRSTRVWRLLVHLAAKEKQREDQ